MHHKVEQAFDEIDAAVCNSDTFEDEDARDTLISCCKAWLFDVLTPEEKGAYANSLLASLRAE